MYNKLRKGDNFEGYVLTESYGAKENQDIVEKVIQAVDGDNGGCDKCPWTHAQLKAAGASYFKSRRDANSRDMKNNADEHRRVCRRQGRIRDKLQRQLDMLEKVNCGQEKREKHREVLTLEYTSSDESDISEDEDGKPQLKSYLTKKFPWERTCLRKTKELLDQKYLDSLPMRSRRSMLPRRKHTMFSTRPIPNNPQEWAVRQVVPNISTSTPL
ncbi:uncharacterized protein LOC116294229 isoform X2 [Actinia tenebrosa]|nr:uncharacterized protein LOC116294229 isoform X2 [Actinia tenebrosa]